MARSTKAIKGIIMAQIAADATLGPILTSTSITSIFGLFAYIVAALQNLMEQVWDQYLAQVKDNTTKAPASNEVLIQDNVFKYQYDPSGAAATNNLTILSNGSVGYATIDPQFNVVTRCAVGVAPDNTVQVRVAQNDASGNPIPITGAAFTQLDDYLTNTLPAGINHSLISDDSDKIAIYGTVYYKPGYAGVIQGNVSASLNTYLSSLSTSAIKSNDPEKAKGLIKVSAIIETVMNAEGVDDFKLTKLLCRANSTLFANASVIYDIVNHINQRQYSLAAGYGVEEAAPNNWTPPNLEFASA